MDNKTGPLMLCALALLLVGCGGNRAAYRQPPVEPALVETPQNDRGMYLDLIRKMQSQGAHFASLAHIEAFRGRFGDTPELRILQADALRETGDNTAAAALYRTLTKGTQAGPAWHGLGLIAAAGKDSLAANQAFENAVRLDPLNVAYLGDQGYALLQSGDFAGARTPLAKAAELVPDNVRAIANLALWAQLSDQPAAAQEMIERARLPEATRMEIYRQAQSLRRRPAAPASTTIPAIADAAAASPTAVVSGQALAAPRHTTPPGSMLDRFAPASSSPHETTP